MNPVDVCNMALDQIGAAGQTIQGLSPPVPAASLAAQVATRNYQTQLDALFRAAHWNAARFQTPNGLTLLKAAAGTPENPSGSLPVPPLPFQYEYALPVDCLKVRFVIPTPTPQSGGAPFLTNQGLTTPPLINTSLPFVVALDLNANGEQIKVILTNAEQAQAVYTARVPNPDTWDPQLLNAAVATLAAWFVNPLLRNSELVKERVQVAMALVTQARVSDGNEAIATTDHIPDWFEVRGAGGGFWWQGRGGAGYMAGWDSMTMPNGLTF